MSRVGLRASLVSLLAGLGLACGAAPPRSTPAPEVEAGARSLAVGDYVVYRYFGRYIGPTPRLLMEEIVARDGDRLVVEHTLSEEHTVLRRWRETVLETETGSPRRVEALCEVQGESCAPLANEGGADLRRMYEGLLVIPDAPAADTTTTEEPQTIGGVEYACQLRTSHVLVAAEPIEVTEVECPDFPWRQAGAVYERADKRQILRVTVEATGS